MSSKSKSTLHWRDAETGRFLTDKQAERKPPSQVVHERVPKPGHGDTNTKQK
jgi:hypothetical protein